MGGVGVKICGFNGGGGGGSDWTRSGMAGRESSFSWKEEEKEGENRVVGGESTDTTTRIVVDPGPVSIGNTGQTERFDAYFTAQALYKWQSTVIETSPVSLYRGISPNKAAGCNKLCLL